MNYKETMHKLEDLKIKKLHEMKDLQIEIGKINKSISKYKKLYIKNNKNAEISTKILEGYSKENIKSILKFILSTMVEHNEFYKKEYKNIDMQLLLDNKDFFDFLIIHIGRPTIDNIKRRFVEVKTIDGEDLMKVTNSGRGLNDENLKKRIYKKFTKNVIIDEAKRLTIEDKKNKEIQ